MINYKAEVVIMDIHVEALSMTNVNHLITLLEAVDFSATPHWATCFCRFYYINCSYDDWKNRSAETNKQDTITAVRNHQMHGFLAFVEEKCVGWVNATDVLHLNRMEEAVRTHIGNQKWGATICFVILNQYRGQKVATTLLAAAINHFKQQGYDGMLALPFDLPTNKEQEYRGPVSLYKTFGYQVVEVKDHTSLMKLTFETR
jgi:GNAT superfamily N-acetyltransferase